MLIGVVTCRAFLRRLCAFMHISAHKTAPQNRFFAFPHSSCLNLLMQTCKAVKMMLLCLSYGKEMLGNFRKTFLLCYLGILVVSLYSANLFLAH